ncbi:tyrosine/serine/threonine protein phosphatase pps1 [Serendipita sp. 407]|nr:tyrosine/serine/threonine protein phosphatase pps1 [Serendipita sp. 407]
MSSNEQNGINNKNGPLGLKYPKGFLSSLPILLSRPAPFAPIRALTAAQFAEIQKLYSFSDEDQLGDSTLFPFLHGIEGNNLSQNTFFANAARSLAPVYAHPLLPPVNPVPTIPKYRGLIWVRADELDDPQVVNGTSPGLGIERDSDDDDDMYSDDEDNENELNDSNNYWDRSMLDRETNGTNPNGIPIPSGRAARSPSTSTSTMSYSSSSDAANSSASTAPTSLPPSPSSFQCTSTPFSTVHSCQLTSSLKAQELLVTCPDGPCFAPPRVPDGISLRNFGIQVPVYATLSDVVVYAPSGMTRSAFALAERFKHAIEAKARERERTSKGEVVHYNVFVVTDHFSEFEVNYPHLVAWDSKGIPSNWNDFAIREREEICNLTQATEVCDGLWLGNSNDVPNYQNALLGADPFDNVGLSNPQGFDICIECCDNVHFPTPKELESVEDHIKLLDELWVSRWRQDFPDAAPETHPPVRSPPSANHILHLAFPSSPPVNQATVHQLLTFINFLQGLLYPEPAQATAPVPSSPTPIYSVSPVSYNSSSIFSSGSSPNSVNFPTSYDTRNASPNGLGRTIKLTRKCKILLYSSDGYTETSILALCLLMAPKPPHYHSQHPPAHSVFNGSMPPIDGATTPQPALERSASETLAMKTFTPSGNATTGMSLPEAYLELQIAKGRSFYVYPSDLDLLKRIESRLYTPSRSNPAKERGRGRDIMNRGVTIDSSGSNDAPNQPTGGFSKWKWSTWGSRASFSIPAPPAEEDEAPQSSSGASAMIIPSLSSSTPSASIISGSSGRMNAATNGIGGPKRRARASTSPMPHVWTDHWAWFSDPRFDGSFPSRVLPFLYLGNLAHASNAYMLHALGITHVVSVGECALIPPQSNCSQAAEYRFSYGGKVLGAGPGSLWIEEREGRIKVLDIKGVSDDGIDSLRPRFREVCDWIDAARQEGGKVLVHCRVGVSRSATVTIAYVMKHLGLSLVDAYLLVRSRRLSVLIQPNLRLLFNLSSWEVELARERAEADPNAINSFLSGWLSWPYLAREVHVLNEKYIQ